MRIKPLDCWLICLSWSFDGGVGDEETYGQNPTRSITTAILMINRDRNGCPRVETDDDDMTENVLDDEILGIVLL